MKAIGGKPVQSSNPTANYLRFVLGYDRFFFFRPLNPNNSFALSLAFNGSINMSARHNVDFRNPNLKPGRSGVKIGPVPGIPACNDAASLPAAAQQLCVSTAPNDFEDQYKFEGFLQTAVQTDYLHGTLTPRIVIITDVTGIFAFAPTATYRFTDNFLGSLTFLAIAGSRETSLATFRDHDMLQLRVTYQLN